MVRKIRESIYSILGLLASLGAIALMYILWFKPYLRERVYPVQGSEAVWLSTFDQWFGYSLAVAFLLTLAWLIHSWVADPEPVSMRRYWWIAFGINLTAGLAIPAAFLLRHSTVSSTINLQVVLCIGLTFFLPFSAASFYPHPEARYCSGLWRFRGL